jgi:GT2 family glycosyltransferase
MPKVSIITLVYKNADLLLEAMPQLEQQTCRDFEQILFSNGCPDDADRIEREWCASRPWARMVRSPSNLGICGGLNAAIAHATGTFVTFFTDDLWTPDHIASLVAALEGSTANAAFSPADDMNAVGGLREHRRPAADLRTLGVDDLAAWFEGDRPTRVPGAVILRALLVTNVVRAVAFLIRRDTFLRLGGYDATLPFEDFDLSLRVALDGDWVFVPDCTTTYVIRGRSFSEQHPERVAQGAADTLAKHLRALRERGLGDDATRAYVRYASWAFFTGLGRRDRTVMQRSLSHALRAMTRLNLRPLAEASSTEIRQRLRHRLQRSAR